ncbi:MAG TPA: NlpC/P60 family protein [Anaerolineaceae bacterium]
METIDRALQTLAEKYADKRLNVFEVTAASAESGRVALAGRVLDQAAREETLRAVRAAAPGVDIDESGLRVLRGPNPQRRAVAANLTSLQGQPDWLSEMTSQLLAGQRLDVLEEQDRWGFVRQEDGYLGWAYLPYLTAAEPLPPTHMVCAPLDRLLDRPDGAPLGRIMGGTRVALHERRLEWARVSVFEQDDAGQPAQVASGWVHGHSLRPLDGMPATPAHRREQIVADALTLLGSPYLWGGCAAGGIDCSGFAQLLHRWIGLEIPRDADLQCYAGRPVEPPYRPGDLLFWGSKVEKPVITHVTVSVGGWHIIHSSRRRNGVYRDDAKAVYDLDKEFIAARTYLD